MRGTYMECILRESEKYTGCLPGSDPGDLSICKGASETDKEKPKLWQGDTDDRVPDAIYDMVGFRNCRGNRASVSDKKRTKSVRREDKYCQKTGKFQ